MFTPRCFLAIILCIYTSFSHVLMMFSFLFLCISFALGFGLVLHVSLHIFFSYSLVFYMCTMAYACYVNRAL